MDDEKKRRPPPPVPKTVRTPEMIDEILQLVASGKSVRQICKLDHMPARSAWIEWLTLDPDLAVRYASARAQGLDAIAEEIIEIADDGTGDAWIDSDGVERTNADVIARSRLRVESRKWLLAKLAPKQYGDRVDLTHSAPDGGPVRTMNVLFGAEPDAEST